LNPRRKAQLIEAFEREENARPTVSFTARRTRTQTNDGGGVYFSKATTLQIPLNDSTSESAPTTTEQEEPSSSQPLALVMPSSRQQRRNSQPAMSASIPQQRKRTDSSANPTTPRSGQPRHPNKPKVTPVKSYKGPTPTVKLQKLKSGASILSDAEKTTSRSRRSTRSMSISTPTPENIRAQDVADSYLTLRNRQLEALSPLGADPRSRLPKNGAGLTPGVNSEIDSRPCRPSTRSEQHHEPRSKVPRTRSEFKGTGIGLDGAGNGRKRKSDTSIASESKPIRSSKRKQPSSGSPNMSLRSDRGDLPAQAPVERIIPVSEDKESFKHLKAQGNFSTSRSPAEANKKQRRPSRSMSSRELSSLLTPHKPAMAVDTSFGASFTQASSTRSTRNRTTTQETVVTEIQPEGSETESPKITASYYKPMLIIKNCEGLKNITDPDLTKNAFQAPRTASSEQVSDVDETENTRARASKDRFARATMPEPDIFENALHHQEDVMPSTSVSETEKQKVKSADERMITVQSGAKLRSSTSPKTSPYIDDRAGYPLKSGKPRLTIDPAKANSHTIKPYHVSKRGMKTPTPRSATFPTPKHSEAPHTTTRTILSSATRKETPGTGSTMSFMEVPSPTTPLAAPQSSVEQRSRRLPLLPSENLAQSPATRPSISGPVAKTSTKLRPTPKSRRLSSPSLNSIQDSAMHSSAPEPVTPATTTPTSGANLTFKELRPPYISGSADSEWRPNSLCADSVLSYATDKMADSWPKMDYGSYSGHAYRGTKGEREGVFRASGILMGVRFVLGLRTSDDEDKAGMKE
jgi:hypothetical protein